MVGLLTALILASLILAGLTLCGEALVAWRRRSAPATNQFAITAALAGLGVIIVGISVLIGDEYMILAAVMLGLLFPLPWLVFSFEYTGRTELKSLQTVAIFATPIVVGIISTALIFGSQLLPWLTLPSRNTASGLSAIAVFTLTITQWIALLYAGALMLVGTGSLLWIFQKYNHLDSMSGTLLGVFGSLPWLSLLLGFQVSDVSTLALPTAISVGFLAGAVTVGGILHQRQLFQSVPAASNIGPSTVMEELNDIVIVTDRDGTVVELNAAARRLPDQPSKFEYGDDIESLIDGELANLEETDVVELRSSDGHREFEPTVSELTDQHGLSLGYAIVLRDVTDRAIRRERLEVFNRVLRHNLRNDTNVILGRAGLLANQLEDQTLEEHVHTIVQTGQRLTDISEHVREVEQLLVTAEREASNVYLEELVHDVFATLPAEIDREKDIPSGLIAYTSGELLQTAVEELIENAVEHNDRQSQFVSVHAHYASDDPYPVIIRITDNGPGIPEVERQAVLEGDETPLKHGSGLGLWLVRWAVTLQGGKLDMDDNDPRGSVVSIRLPRGHLDENKACLEE